MDVLFCCHSFYLDWQISNSLITCYFPFEIHVFSDRSHTPYRVCDLHCCPGRKIQTRVEKYSLSHWYLLVNCKCKYHQKQWSRYWYYAYDTAHIWCALPNSWLICTCASHCQWHRIWKSKNMELIKSTSGIYDLRKLAALRKIGLDALDSWWKCKELIRLFRKHHWYNSTWTFHHLRKYVQLRNLVFHTISVSMSTQKTLNCFAI